VEEVQGRASDFDVDRIGAYPLIGDSGPGNRLPENGIRTTKSVILFQYGVEAILRIALI
jgi:hypothetical protein